MQKRHLDRRAYFKEQARTTEKYYIPYIQKYIKNISGKVLEIGCGEGGNLLPFVRLGCEGVGVDIAETRIAEARQFFEEEGQKAVFIASDIFKLEEYKHQFPLIIIHDVIEHIGPKEQFMKDLRDFLSPGGIIFIAFPAWQMPFGGHQQVAQNKIIAHFPFVHLLPTFLYKFVLKLFGEKKDCVEGLLDIKRTRCTIECFLQVMRRTNYEIISQQLYFINPHYETKFGLKPRKLNKIIARIPYLRNFFSTSCFYLVRPYPEEC